MLARFIPKNEQFYTLFRQAAEVGDEIARAFVDLVEHYHNVERKVRAIREIEHRGDVVSGQVAQALTQTFVTPIDHKDIVLLSERLDDFIDAIEEAARRLWLYRFERPDAHTRAMAGVIAKQASALKGAVPLLEDLKTAPILLQKTAEVRRLEDEADALMDEAEVSLYDDFTDVPGMIRAMRRGELYEYLEEATDRAQDVAKALEGVALKHG
jgi:predicted phosphate transport protein (TIGR00153 family)